MMADADRHGRATGDYSRYNELALQKPRVDAQYAAEVRSYRPANNGYGGGYGGGAIIPGIPGLGGYGNTFTGNSGAGLPPVLAPFLGIAGNTEARYLQGLRTGLGSNAYNNGRVRANEILPRKTYRPKAPPPQRKK
jgi:hypothetical protein